jgi:intracellular multiplication protein IcmO
VDLKDVVLNRRILVVLLPALEKAPDELANLGKVIIASLKAMMAAGLGDAVEGTYKEVISRKPTACLTPYMCILDEYGYYAVKGFAVVPAQARSLGFSVIFAGQDLPAFQKASKEEAASIGANTNIKICMKLEDPAETWEFFSKTAGESWVTKVDSFQTNAGSLLNNYMDSRSASSEKRARVDLLDLKEQREGEAHVFFKSKIVRARMFFANPPAVKQFRLNHFLKVEPPIGRTLIDLENRLEEFDHILEREGEAFKATAEEAEEIHLIANVMHEKKDTNLIERGVSALLAFHNRQTMPAEEETLVTEEAEVSGHINLFSKPILDESVKQLVGADYERFSQPLVNKAFLKTKVELLERILGRSGSQSSTIAQEILKDILNATDYPPSIEGIFLETEVVIQAAKELVSYISSLRSSGESGE